MLAPSSETEVQRSHREWDEWAARRRELVRAEAQRLASEYSTSDLLDMRRSAIMGQACDREERMHVLALAIELKRGM
jgi:hypothetical protein